MGWIHVLASCSVIVVGCDSEKPKAKLVMPDPPTFHAPPPPRLAASTRTVSPGSGTGTAYQRDRTAACAAFADRFAPSMKNDAADPAEATAKQCMIDKRITKDSYTCLIATASAEGIDACFTKFPAGKPLADGKACAAYGKHVVALMADDLHKTARDTCMSDRMTEPVYDCVMAATTDAGLKHCVGM